MAARIARTSFARCVQVHGSKCRISRSLSTSRLLLLRGTNQRTVHNLDPETDATAHDDFFGIAGEHGVVTVQGSETFTRDRLEKFEHLARSRNARVSDVKVVVTGFGTIRYDSDNQPRYHGQYEDDRLIDDVHLDGFVSDNTANQIPEPRRGAAKSVAGLDVGRGASETTGSRNKPALSASEVLHERQVANGTGITRPSMLPAAQVVPEEKRRQKVSRQDTKQLSNVEEQRTIESSKTASDQDRSSLHEIHGNVGITRKHKTVHEPQKVVQTRQRQRLSESSPVVTPPLQTETVDHLSGKTAAAAKEKDFLNKLLKTRQDLVERDDTVAKDDERKSRTDTELGSTEVPPGLQQDVELTKRGRSGQKITKRSGERNRFSGTAPEHKEQTDNSRHPDSEEQQTAYDYLRQESPPSSVKLDSKGFRILKSEVRPDLSRLLHSEAVDLLRKRVLYNDNDILVLDKPYGMLCHGPSPDVSDACILTKLLPDLSSALYPRQDTKLYTVHRLDRDVTGVLLLARTQRMADTLNSLFRTHRVSKTYLAITFGVPDHLEGVIDMPLAEGEVDGAKRMVLSPKLDPEFQRLVPKFRKSFAAVTRYRVLASHGRAGYLELRPTTGVKHQLRVHLGLGLRCPILGDHKYSHLRRLAPQKLSGDMLERLGIRQSKVRDAPLHLHARAVVVPEILDGRNLTVAADVPYHFAKNLRRLRLNRD